MAISPSIPTSFVPKQLPPGGSRATKHGNDYFVIGAFVLLLLVVGVAAGEFFYAHYLVKAELAKAQQILDAQKSISQDTVNQFTRLRNRLNAAKTVANQHIALTQFLNLLETITVQDVHFTAIDIKVNDDRTATITMTGQAATFNALETQSTVFAKQQDIQNAVFSGFTLNKDTSVSFNVAATLDSAIILEKVPVSQQPVPVFSGVTGKIITPTASATAPTPTTPTTTGTTTTTTTTSTTTSTTTL